MKLKSFLVEDKDSSMMYVQNRNCWCWVPYALTQEGRTSAAMVPNYFSQNILVSALEGLSHEMVMLDIALKFHITPPIRIVKLYFVFSLFWGQAP